MNTTAKTRQQIIDECIGAIAACFNYYSDEPLGPHAIRAVQLVLNRVLPPEISTEEWQKIKDEYQARIEAETEENG